MAPIHDACIRGDIEAIQRILDNTDNTDTLLTSNNETGMNAFVLAFINKQYEVVRYISKGASRIEIYFLLQGVLKQHKLDCSIHDAIDNGYMESYTEDYIIEEIKSLLNEGNDVNSMNSELDTPLHLVCRYKLKFVLQFLLENGGDVHSLNRNLKQPIHELCDMTHNFGDNDNPQIFEDMLTILINKGADLDSQDSQNQTPFDILFEHPGYGENIKKAFTNVMVKSVINLKQSLETAKKEINVTPQVQSLLIHTSIAIKQLEYLESIKQV